MSNKVISFDIWDTIIKRKCHPEEIKLKTAYYIVLKYGDLLKDDYKDIYSILLERDDIEAELCKKAEKAGYDAECRIEEVFQELQKEILTKKHEDISKELLEVELENEKNVIYVNPDILPIFEKYKDCDMYCVSDFYMSGDSLNELINYLKLPVKFKKIYSSADYLLNKKTGNLYRKFEEEVGIDTSKHIHVGDNEYTDIAKARELGIETIQMKKEYVDFSPVRNRKLTYDLKSVKKDNNSKKNKIFNEGVELAPLLYFFVYNVIEYAIKKGIDKIYYQTREGETFIKVHDYIAKHNPFPVKVPESSTMEVSRMSTFAASLNEFSIDELMRLWSQYKKQSIIALFKSLNIKTDKYEEYFTKYELTLDEEIDEPWQDQRMINLCKDKNFTKLVNEELKQKRNEFLEFFEKKYKLVNDDKPMFIVDIGWRGTIQDNIAYIFDKKSVGGFYITLYDFYNKQPKNTFKNAFIDNKEVRDTVVVDIITLLEWIYNPGTGSVVGYKNGESIRKIKDKEAYVVSEYIKPLQAGMFKGMEVINEYLIYHPYEAEEGKEVAYVLLKKVKEKPSKILVEAYYSMVFNDTFGSGEIVEKAAKLTFFQKFNVIKCRNILRQESWKEAFMTYNNLWYLKYLVGFKGFVRKMLKKK